MRTLIGMAIAAFLLCPVAEAQEVMATDPGAASVARAALETFPRLVSQQNYSQLGFDSPGDVEQAELGEPLTEYMIRLDELKDYTADSNPEALLKSTQQIIYPVAAGGSVRSGVTLNKSSGEWRAVAFGKATLARLLDEQRSIHDVAGDTSEDRAFAVRIPALNLYLLGSREDSQLNFTPLMDDARFDFEKGKAMPAADALSRLVPFARKLEDDLPT